MSMEIAIGEVLDPFIDAGIPADGLVFEAAGYTVMRELATTRAANPGLDPALRAEWMPTADDIEQIRSSVAPHIPFLTARKRLLRYADDDSAVADLHPHQAVLFEKAVGNAADTRTAPESHKCFVSATGSGKSYLMGTFIDALHREEQNKPESPPKKTLVLTPTNFLVDQVEADLEERDFGALTGVFNKDRKELDKPVTIMTYASFIEQTKNKIIKKGDYDQVLLDEADMALAPDTRAEMKDFISQSIAYGFTATGKNGKHRDVADIFTHVDDTYDTDRCIKEGILSPAQVWLVKTGEQLEIGNIKRFNDIPQEKLRELGERASRGLLSAKIAKDFVGSGMKGLIRCPAGDSCSFAINRAEQLNSLMFVGEEGKTRKIRAAAVGSGIKDSREIIKAYKRGEYDVLCYVKLVGRGFDDVDTDFFIDESPTLSPVEGVQGPGRALRYREGKIAQIVHLLDDITSNGEPVRAYTMLQTLGVSEYEPGLFFGPDDRWRGGQKQYDLKPYEHLELFSHEIHRLIKQTAIDIQRSDFFGTSSEHEAAKDHVSIAELARIADVKRSRMASFIWDNNGFTTKKPGRSLLYDRRVADVFLEREQIHGLDVDPLDHGWVKPEGMDELFLQELKVRHSFLAPVKHQPTKAKRKSVAMREYFSPSQYKFIEEEFLKNAVERKHGSDGKHSVLTVDGMGYEDLVESTTGKPIISHYTSSELTYCFGGKPSTTRFQEFDKLNDRVTRYLHGSPLFRSISRNTAEVQEAYDKIAESLGVKGRVVRYKSQWGEPTAGYFINDNEYQAIEEGLAERFDSLTSQLRGYSRSDIRIQEQHGEQPRIDAQEAIRLASRMLHNRSYLGGGEELSGNLNDFILNIYKAVGEIPTKPLLVIQEYEYRAGSYSDSKRFILHHTLNLLEVLQAITAAAKRHGLDVTELFAEETKTLESLYETIPLVAAKYYREKDNIITH